MSLYVPTLLRDGYRLEAPSFGTGRRVPLSVDRRRPRLVLYSLAQEVALAAPVVVVYQAGRRRVAEDFAESLWASGYVNVSLEEVSGES